MMGRWAVLEHWFAMGQMIWAIQRLFGNQFTMGQA